MTEVVMTSGTIEEQCAELGTLLDLDGPVPEDVLRAAVHDVNYAHNLLVCRGNDDFLNYLIANPPKVDAAADANDIGTATLLARAAESLSRWAATGFSTVTKQRYSERLKVCASCPHLQAPPERRAVLYAIAGARSDSRDVCGKCGCVVTAKARRASDTCPDRDPERPGVNRWGEPIAS